MCRREVVVAILLVTFFLEIVSFYAPFIKVNFENSFTNVGFAWSQNCVADKWEEVEWNSILCLVLFVIGLALGGIGKSLIASYKTFDMTQRRKEQVFEGSLICLLLSELFFIAYFFVWGLIIISRSPRYSRGTMELCPLLVILGCFIAVETVGVFLVVCRKFRGRKGGEEIVYNSLENPKKTLEKEEDW